MTDNDYKPEIVDRLRVALVAEGMAALDRLCEHSGLSKADLINRALQVYDFIETEKRHGKRLALVDDADRVQVVTME